MTTPTMRENVEMLLNHGRVLKAIFSIADEIQSIEQLNQLRAEAEQRLALVADREASLKTVEADLTEKTAELEKLDAKLSLAREAWRQVMGDANV
ncbi:hypothetical protein NKJ59_03590 [Mesorhizobium australicum]|uniref:hypothetical protein n=1 Tax=Mesorhizobium australicum TaxID=536018 RepID=UPI00333C1E74